MRIAQISPIVERTPPRAYGGTELVVQLLTDELVRQGHEVTLFASGDSLTTAQLSAVVPAALRPDVDPALHLSWEVIHMTEAMKRAGEFEIIHNHLGPLSLAFSLYANTPTVHTLHGPLFPEWALIYRHFRDRHYVSISDAQREGEPSLNYAATVYHGLNLAAYPFEPLKNEYLLHLGRISPQKGTHLAIAAAKKLDRKLIIAAKVDAADQAYYQERIAPHIDGDQICFLGEVGHAEKVALLGKATCLLMPISYPEPFGLVMIESMACGTPVIAFAAGSAPEVVAQGESGYLVHSLAEMIDAVQRLDQITPLNCRRQVEENFTVEKMTNRYLEVYRSIIAERPVQTSHMAFFN